MTAQETKETGSIDPTEDDHLVVSTMVDTEETGTIVPEPEPEPFPLDYAKKPRKEAADARVKAKRTDVLATRLHAALVSATGPVWQTRPTFDDAHLDSTEAMTAALDALLVAKPHLANRKPRGDVGQGQSGVSPAFDLAGMLRQRAG